MNAELLNWLKRQGPIGLIILFLWLFRDQVSFTFHFGQAQAGRQVAAVEEDRRGDETRSQIAPSEVP